MGIIINNLGDIILNITIYAVLFNIIYSMIFAGKNFWISVLIYVVTMIIKLFIMYGSVPIHAFFISIIVYVILGIIIIKLLDEMANDSSKLSCIIWGIIIAYVLDMTLAKILYSIISLAILLLYAYVTTIFIIFT